MASQAEFASVADGRSGLFMDKFDKFNQFHAKSAFCGC